jgi:hypothetical protein
MGLSIQAASLIVVLLATTGCTSTQSTAIERDVWSSANYEVSCDGVGTGGTQVLEVASFGKDFVEAMSVARRDAVHAILFKGVQSEQCSVPPLVGQNDYIQNESLFKSFFSSPGPYLDFVSLASDVPSDLVHIGGRVKAYTNVVVNRNGLRRHLVEAGVIEELGSVFERNN